MVDRRALEAIDYLIQPPSWPTTTQHRFTEFLGPGVGKTAAAISSLRVHEALKLLTHVLSDGGVDVPAGRVMFETELGPTDLRALATALAPLVDLDESGPEPTLSLTQEGRELLEPGQQLELLERLDSVLSTAR